MSLNEEILDVTFCNAHAGWLIFIIFIINKRTDA